MQPEKWIMNGLLARSSIELMREPSSDRVARSQRLRYAATNWK
jgi:hypothetical protein